MASRELEERREAILEEMRGMRTMKRGTLNKQYLKVKSKGRKEPMERGPYFVFSRREGSRTVSSRLRSAEEVEQAQKGISEHKAFLSLCREFETVTERLAEHAKGQSEVEKKKRRSLRSKDRAR